MKKKSPERRPPARHVEVHPAERAGSETGAPALHEDPVPYRTAAPSSARPPEPKSEPSSALRFIDLFCGIGELRFAKNLGAMLRQEGQLRQRRVVGQTQRLSGISPEVL